MKQIINIIKTIHKQECNSQIFLFKSCNSTNTQALIMIKRQIPIKSIIITCCQYLGKGRFKRTWITNHGGLAITFICYPILALNKLYKLNFIISKTIIKYLKHIKIQSMLKWPNDILIYNNHYDYEKAIGILIEIINYNTNNILMIGIGINIYKNHILHKTSCIYYNNTKIKINHILLTLIQSIEKHINNIYYYKYFHNILYFLNNHCYNLKKYMIIKINKKYSIYKAININHDGSLILQTLNHKKIALYNNNISNIIINKKQ